MQEKLATALEAKAEVGGRGVKEWCRAFSPVKVLEANGKKVEEVQVRSSSQSRAESSCKFHGRAALERLCIWISSAWSANSGCKPRCDRQSSERPERDVRSFGVCRSRFRIC